MELSGEPSSPWPMYNGNRGISVEWRNYYSSSDKCCMNDNKYSDSYFSSNHCNGKSFKELCQQNSYLIKRLEWYNTPNSHYHRQDRRFKSQDQCYDPLGPLYYTQDPQYDSQEPWYNRPDPICQEICCKPSIYYRSKSWIKLNQNISYYLSYLIFTDYQKMLQSQISSSPGKV